MSFDKDWDESVPTGSSDVRSGDDAIRNFKYAIRERLAVDHNFHLSETGESNIGAHDQLTLLTRTAPTLLADAIRLYGKDVDGKCELHVKNEDGTEVRWSRLGYILGDSVRLTNDTYLKAINAAGSGTVDLIKANASDVVVLPDGAELATSGAPTTDAGIVNKKYHDDDISARFDVNIGHHHDGNDSRKLDSTGISGLLGNWASKSNNTVYQATTDGFVCAIAYGGGNLPKGYTDSSNPPTTVRAAAYSPGGESNPASITMPVRKNDYWKVTGSVDVYWIPLGS